MTRFLFAERSPIVRFMPILALVIGCQNSTVTPQSGNVQTLDALWPNDDGRTWDYDLTVRQWNDLTATNYDSLSMVPPIPPLTDVANELSTDPAGSPDSTALHGFRAWFAGIDTTSTGVAYQNLRAAVVSSATTAVRAGLPSRILEDLFIARPDLRQRLREAYPDAGLEASKLDHDSGPVFIGGYYRKTEDYIGSANDLDTEIRFRWLESDLSVGHEWTTQLVPQISNDVFLHARVLGRRTLSVPSGTYNDVLEVVYALDYGVSLVTDHLGNTLGYRRGARYATIAYAPTVGPIRVHERFVSIPDVILHSFAGTVDLVMEHRADGFQDACEFSGITETDAIGAEIGNVDPDDWCTGVSLYPNPVSGAATLQFSLASMQHVRVGIRDERRLDEIRILLDQDMPAGIHTLVWDLKDSSGLRVRQGIHCIEFESDAIHCTGDVEVQ